MARDYFTVEKGLQLLTENGSEGVKYLFGSGVPSLEAEVGSKYQRTDSGEEYLKISVGTGTDKWLRMATVNDITALSWRSEKVVALTADAAPSTGSSIDLVSNPFGDDDAPLLTAADFSVDDHILFGAGGTEKLMRVSVVSAPSITVVDADDALADNDMFIVRYYLPDSPDAQEKQAIVLYNGSDYIKVGDFNWDLADGINLPSGYAEGNGYITSADTVNSAIQKLDGNQIDLITLSGVAQGSVDLGSFTGTIIPDSSTIKDALQALEVDVDAIQTLTGVVAESVDLGSFTGSTISDNQTIKAALQELETALEDVQTVLSATGVTSVVTLDSVLVDDVLACEWYLVVYEDAAPTKRNVYKIHGAHNGHAGADATKADSTSFGILRLGSAITGLTIDVDVNGTTTSQTMRLRVGSTNATTFKAIRRKVV